MTPWDWVTSAVNPSGVGVYALDAKPTVPYGVSELPDILAPLPAGEIHWLETVTVDSTGTLATRQVEFRFSGLQPGQSQVAVQGVAVVDAGPPANLLLLVSLPDSALFGDWAATLVVAGSVVVTRH